MQIAHCNEDAIQRSLSCVRVAYGPPSMTNNVGNNNLPSPSFETKLWERSGNMLMYEKAYHPDISLNFELDICFVYARGRIDSSTSVYIWIVCTYSPLPACEIFCPF